MFVPVCACEEELLGPREVLSAFVGAGVPMVTGTGSQKKTLGAPESLVAFAGPRPEYKTWSHAKAPDHWMPARHVLPHGWEKVVAIAIQWLVPSERGNVCSLQTPDGIVCRIELAW